MQRQQLPRGFIRHELAPYVKTLHNLSSFSHPRGAEPPYVRSHRAVSQRHISITAKKTKPSRTIPLLISWQVTSSGSASAAHNPLCGAAHRSHHARAGSVIHLPPASCLQQRPTLVLERGIEDGSTAPARHLGWLCNALPSSRGKALLLHVSVQYVIPEREGSRGLP